MIAVIGGSGFIGTRLVKRLIEAGQAVAIIDKADSKAFPALVRKADVRDPAGLREAMRGCDIVYNLAAEHRDDVRPKSLYEDVNVGGARNVCSVAAELGVKKIVFTSSVAVYGFAPADTDETGAFAPFNEYGRTKMEAEGVLRQWLSGDPGRSLVIVRPTVVFGERNRGNVYNLIKQMASGRFAMVGNGKNVKSIAYVENVAAFLEFALTFKSGENLFNYVDKPDLDMNALVELVREMMGKPGKIGVRAPYWLGFIGGMCFDMLSAVTGKKFAISSIRVKKFCSTTQFASSKKDRAGFAPPVEIRDGLARTIKYEFLENNYGDDSHVFVSE
jgi:GlcNAc-P-P-Und epimerase